MHPKHAKDAKNAKDGYRGDVIVSINRYDIDVFHI